jgi:hypothetical protein
MMWFVYFQTTISSRSPAAVAMVAVYVRRLLQQLGLELDHKVVCLYSSYSVGGGLSVTIDTVSLTAAGHVTTRSLFVTIDKISNCVSNLHD